MSRDRVLALLWPELDSDRARNNLKQVVFTLRNSLRPDIFVAHGTMLILNPAAVTVDTRAFQHLLDAGDLASAVELYSGPLLDGFHLGDLPAFDEWLERERALLERRHTAALEQLAHRAKGVGDGRSAVELLRRLTERDPLRADYSLALMQAFVDLGEPASALQSARAHERVVRLELQADPDPRVTRLAESVRASLTPATNVAVPAVPQEASRPSKKAIAISSKRQAEMDGETSD